MKKRRYRSFVFALALIALSGLLLSALARTGPAVSTRTFALNSATNLLRRMLKSASATTATHNVMLSKARVSTLANNRTVIVMETEGDVPGVLTLAVDVSSDGTIAGGEWALVSTEADEHPGSHSDHHHDSDSDHGDVMMIQKGVLKGLVSGGTVSLNANGTLNGLNSVQLAVNSGTLIFHGIASGDGIANWVNLDNSQASSGALTLNF